MIDFKPVYIGIIKNICGSGIISSKQIRIKGFKEMKYNLNLELIQDYIILNQYINPNADNFKPEFIEMFNIKPNIELLELQQAKVKKINFLY